MRFLIEAMNRPSHLRQQDSLTPDDPTLDISSLIDVCFLLLIYFLVTTTIQPREQDLNMTVPTPPKHENPFLIQPMLIQVEQNGEVLVNPGDAAEVYDLAAESRVLPQLKERLKTLSGMGPANVPRVLLKVHDEVKQQRYIDVINCLAGAGISDIALQD